MQYCATNNATLVAIFAIIASLIATLVAFFTILAIPLVMLFAAMVDYLHH